MATTRGYFRGDSGHLRIIDIPIDDNGHALDVRGNRIDLSGKPVVRLIGWPDDYAVEIDDWTLIAINAIAI